MTNRPSIKPCNCGSTALTIECTRGSHYEMSWVECQVCGHQGSGDFDFTGAINEWNKTIIKDDDES